MPRLSSHFGLRDPRLASLVYPLTVVSTLPADANTTYTVGQLLGGFILRGGSMTAARTDTLPAAGALVEAIQGCMVNTSFEFYIRNSATGAFTITLNPGTGGTFSPAGANTIAQNNTKCFILIFTNVTFGQEAYQLHSLGSAVT